MQQFVAEPVEFAGFAAESRLERVPRSTKVRRTVDAFMKQQCRTVFCILMNKNFCNKFGNDETDIHNNNKHNGLLSFSAKGHKAMLRPVRRSVRPSSCLSHAPSPYRANCYRQNFLSADRKSVQFDAAFCDKYKIVVLFNGDNNCTLYLSCTSYQGTLKITQKSTKKRKKDTKKHTKTPHTVQI